MRSPAQPWLCRFGSSAEPVVARYDGHMAGWHLEHTYTELPQLFYASAAPTAVREPRLIVFNRPLASALGLDVEALEGPRGRRDFRRQYPARRRAGR